MSESIGRSSPAQAVGRLLGVSIVVCMSTQIGSAQEARKFTVDEVVRQGTLGFSASIFDDVGFAGAPAGTSKPGTGFLFDMTTGNKLFSLTPSVNPPDNLFGFNAKIYDDYLLVGDPANPFKRSPDPGAAYVFDVNTGNQLARLQPDDSFGGDEFGFGINLFEELAIIGAPNLGTGFGAAYLFDVGTGSQLRKLVPNDPLAGSEFGGDVGINRDYAVVGAPANFQTLGFAPGAAYVFDTDTGNQLHKLIPNDSFGGDEFGFDIAVNGNLAVIGAPNGGSDKGAAYLFDLETGSQLFRFQPADIDPESDFGQAVDIFGNLIAVGASGLGQVDGAVYLFDAATGNQIDKLQPSDNESDNAFGISLGLYQDRLFVGSALDDDTTLNAGAAYLFGTTLPPALPGDFNGDQVLDVIDIDLLTQAVFQGSMDTIYDVNGDGQVNQGDRSTWVNDIFGTFFGDANLDGEFSSTDLIVVLQGGVYEDNVALNATWGTGDFNGDLEFDSSDLITALQSGAYEQGPRAAVTAVPEPAVSLLLLAALPCLGRLRRRA